MINNTKLWSFFSKEINVVSGNLIFKKERKVPNEFFQPTSSCCNRTSLSFNEKTSSEVV